MEKLKIPENRPRTLTVFTDRRITRDSLKTASSHAHLIEEIRTRVTTLNNTNWRIEFSWVKADAGILGNETADKLAKAAARCSSSDIAYRRIPVSSVYEELQKDSIQKWQNEWDHCTKATTTEQFFPSVEQRLNRKLRITQNVAAMLTGHGKTRAYLHCFNIRDNATCACEKGDQTIDHLIYNCTLLETQRRILRDAVRKDGQWPAGKQELISKHLDPFMVFIESIDVESL